MSLSFTRSLCLSLCTSKVSGHSLSLALALTLSLYVRTWKRFLKSTNTPYVSLYLCPYVSKQTARVRKQFRVTSLCTAFCSFLKGLSGIALSRHALSLPNKVRRLGSSHLAARKSRLFPQRELANLCAFLFLPPGTRGLRVSTSLSPIFGNVKREFKQTRGTDSGFPMQHFSKKAPSRRFTFSHTHSFIKNHVAEFHSAVGRCFAALDAAQNLLTTEINVSNDRYAICDSLLFFSQSG